MKHLRPSLRRLGIVVFSGCLIAIASFGWAQGMQIIELEHRTAEEIVPVLEPLLEPGAAISGSQYTLFVRASAANVEQLRRALAALDRPQQQFRISVRQSTRAEIERERLAASGTIATSGGRIAVNESPRGETGVTLRGTASTHRQDADNVTTVQVLEGNAAYIASGESVPLVTAGAVGGGRRPWAAATVEYRDVASGYEVRPRLSGDRVTLEIEQHSERRGQNDRIETQRLSTRITGALGEWLELGGIDETSSSQGSGILTRSHSTRSDARSLWIKVELSR